VTFLANGPAVLAGNLLAGRVVELHRSADQTDWSSVWLVPLVGYIVAFVVFVALFRDRPAPGLRDQKSELSP
jgi:hypothetical protein